MKQAREALVLAHTQFEASLRPLVDFDTEDDPDEENMGVAIQNSGTGPAIIKKVTYYVDGKPVPGSKDAVQIGKQNADKINYFDFDPDDTLGTGQKEWLIYRLKKFRKDKPLGHDFADFIDDRLGILAEFCSLTGQCWPKCSTRGRCGDVSEADGTKH